MSKISGTCTYSENQLVRHVHIFGNQDKDHDQGPKQWKRRCETRNSSNRSTSSRAIEIPHRQHQRQQNIGWWPLLLPCTELAHIRQGSRIRGPHQRIRLIAEYPGPQKSKLCFRPVESSNPVTETVCRHVQPRAREKVRGLWRRGLGRKGWADFYLSNAIFCQSLQQQYIGTNLRRKRASHMQGPIFRSHALRVWLLELRMSLLACDCPPAR